MSHIPESPTCTQLHGVGPGCLYGLFAKQSHFLLIWGQRTFPNVCTCLWRYCSFLQEEENEDERGSSPGRDGHPRCKAQASLSALTGTPTATLCQRESWPTCWGCCWWPSGWWWATC